MSEYWLDTKFFTRSNRTRCKQDSVYVCYTCREKFIAPESITAVVLCHIFVILLICKHAFDFPLVENAGHAEEGVGRRGITVQRNAV